MFRMNDDEDETLLSMAGFFEVVFICVMLLQIQSTNR